MSEATTGAGRPPVGPTVQIRLPADLLEWVDQQAAAAGQNRAAYIREVLETVRGGR